MFDNFIDVIEKIANMVSNKVEERGRAIARRGNALFGAGEYEQSDIIERVAGIAGFHDDMYARIKKKRRQGLELGDIVKVSRTVYDHYGVYIGKGKIIHYTSEDSDINNGTIQATSFRKFLREQKKYDILIFPEHHGSPRGVNNPTFSFPQLNHVTIWNADKKYCIYTPKETVCRAKSRLGENSYNLVFNNCEHFAIWCKTGVSESHQVNNIINSVAIIMPMSSALKYFMPH